MPVFYDSRWHPAAVERLDPRGCRSHLGASFELVCILMVGAALSSLMLPSTSRPSAYFRIDAFLKARFYRQSI